MPTNTIEQTADVLVKVENILTRFEAVRVGNSTQDSASLQEIQKLASRVEAQFTQINSVLETINQAQRIFSGDVGTLGIDGSDISPTASGRNIRRSQDEWAHLFSRLVIGGFDNF